MRKILYTLPFIVLSACSSFLGGTNTIDESRPSPTISDSENNRLNSALCQEGIEGGIVKIDYENFRLDENGAGYGQFSFEGTLTNKEELAPFSGESVDVVYLIVENDGSVAFSYFKSYAENKDSINKMVDDFLYFKLGVLENGALELGAELTEGTEEKILSALETGESIRLTMLQAVTLGSGASEYSVMPCVIDAN